MEADFDEAITPASHLTLPVGPGSDPEKGVFWSEVLSRGTLGTVGRFMLRDLIGDGGFGQVYKAYDPRLDRDVALKVLRELDPGERVMQRFFREARAAARLCHPNIVSVHDAGYDDDRCWIAFEFVSGCTLARRLDQQDLEIAEAVRIARDLATALDHAHCLGVYHRDIKPANVIIDRFDIPHLIDFGLARRADLDSGLTREGSILGTPRYMPPEQANGRSHLADARSDVYSLGVLLFEMLGGRRSDGSPSKATPWQFRPETPPPPLRTVNPSAPAALEAICTRALASDPEERYPDAGVFARALERWLKRRRLSLILERRQVSVAVGFCLISLVVAGLAVLLSSQSHPIAAGNTSASSPLVSSGKSQSTRVVEQTIEPRLDETSYKPSPPTPIESVADARKGAVIRIKSSKTYHLLSDCRYLKEKHDLESFATEQAARDHGCKLCDYCQKKLGEPAAESR